MYRATNFTFVFEVYLTNKNKVFLLDFCVETDIYKVIVHDRCANLYIKLKAEGIFLTLTCISLMSSCLSGLISQIR